MFRLIAASRWTLLGFLFVMATAEGCGRSGFSPRRVLPSDGSPGSPAGAADLAAPTTDGEGSSVTGAPASDGPAAPAPDVAPTLFPDVGPNRLPDGLSNSDARVAYDLALPASEVAPDLATSLCGNGFLDLPREECDDGNTLSGDGCDSSCRLECGWECPPWPRTPLVICGDGIRRGGEACDDGNTNRGDGCSDTCRIEPGFRCNVPGIPCSPICGDRKILGREDCDDGNTTSGDGCSEFCLTEPGWDCSTGTCIRVFADGGAAGNPRAYCGNGVVEGAEECDPGTSHDIHYGGCDSTCRLLVCGDGIINGPEECDLGFERNTSAYGDPSGCTPLCTIPPYCGDSRADTAYGEDCDWGAKNGSSGSLCDQACHYIMI